ncbi:M48 family metalloprotease [Adhaeribacter rhizoryzae]|uniref:Uncharacterized protein n=1 Tax=Adhaeribacter rhizoryzae TaxID=2607907 RepID=A0A5M6DRD7_9BACT|nr:hypothetical protein [Adhaeribacter rhizoryzae]KAA5548812.1 hypothetical protein F0145_04675 [Adhaeribacter rhizoryzae]
MKQLKLFTAAIACSFILLNGCKTESDLSVTPTATEQNSQLSVAAQENLAKLRAALPADAAKQLKQGSNLLITTDQQYREMAQRAINAIAPTPCNDNTPTNIWLDQQLADWNRTVINYAIDLDMLNLPTYDALVFENSSENQYYGVNGEYTQRLTKTFKDLKRFWNIESDNIIMAAMHGNMLQDRDKLIRTYTAAYGMNEEDAAFYADFVLALVDAFPQYRKGNHPIFTYNAFAQQGFNLPGYGIIPDKIIMGDGIMDSFAAVGFADIAPQAILAHEFAHHIQFDLNLFTAGPRTPEATRRTELMADAYAAYYLSHARGAAMQWKRVQQFLQVFFNIGDCSFTSTSHHGTPTQRIAAAQWAYNLANSAQKQGHILSAQEFAVLFEAQLPKLVK